MLPRKLIFDSADRFRSARTGMTMIEVLVVIGVLTLASSFFLEILLNSARLRRLTHERALAADAAWVVLERMRHEPFEELFARFDPDPGNDPDGKASAPGNRFRVRGLRPLPDAVDETVGEIVLPGLPKDEEKLKKKQEEARKKEEKEQQKQKKKGQKQGLAEPGVRIANLFFPARPDFGDYQLREDYDDLALGMPRDLDGDNIVDDEDHAKDYVRLPVCVRVSWEGPNGPTAVQVYTMFAANDAAASADPKKKKKKKKDQGK